VRADLHTHSRVSDGTDTPADLVRGAQRAGLDLVALTDHDTAAGWDEAAATAREIGIGFIPGMEISTQLDDRAIHLLAYLPDPTYEPLAAELDAVLRGRAGRVPTMVGRLRELGIAITEDDVFAQSEDAAATGRPHVADALIALGVVDSRDEAFDRYLGWGRPAYARRYAAPLDTMIRLVTAAGGVTVIAHPWGRRELEWPDEAELARLRDVGLTGIEVDHEDHSPEKRDRLRALARDLGLVATGSSDYHGTGKIAHDLGVNTTPADQLALLLDAADAASAASGRPTPERHVLP
jgi:predicted metal-dependent phosphoesterase TrpH